jgi:GYF domain 2
MSDWHYLDGSGSKTGPLSLAQMEALAKSEKIDRNTHVWKQGMKEWQPLRETELSSIFAENLPPPVPAALVNNSIVWFVAFIPLVVAIAEVILTPQYYVELHIVTAPKVQIPWFIIWPINAALCLWDDRILRKAGYSTKAMAWFAVLLVPVYLFMRAKKLKQRPYYGFVWIACFAIGLLADAGL